MVVYLSRNSVELHPDSRRDVWMYSFIVSRQKHARSNFFIHTSIYTARNVPLFFFVQSFHLLVTHLQFHAFLTPSNHIMQGLPTALQPFTSKSYTHVVIRSSHLRSTCLYHLKTFRSPLLTTFPPTPYLLLSTSFLTIYIRAVPLILPRNNICITLSFASFLLPHKPRVRFRPSWHYTTFCTAIKFSVPYSLLFSANFFKKRFFIIIL